MNHLNILVHDMINLLYFEIEFEIKLSKFGNLFQNFVLKQHLFV